MVRRSRVIFTRSSRSARSRGPDGAAGRAGGAGWAEIEDRAAITSALVARPSLPEGWMAAAGTFFSSASLRTAGPDAAILAPAATGAGWGADWGAGAGLGAAGWAAGALAGFGAAPAAPASMWQSRPPTWTVAPSATARSTTAPATLALTSTVTLSVSSSHNG